MNYCPDWYLYYRSYSNWNAIFRWKGENCVSFARHLQSRHYYFPMSVSAERCPTADCLSTRCFYCLYGEHLLPMRKILGWRGKSHLLAFATGQQLLLEPIYLHCSCCSLRGTYFHTTTSIASLFHFCWRYWGLTQKMMPIWSLHAEHFWPITNWCCFRHPSLHCFQRVWNGYWLMCFLGGDQKTCPSLWRQGSMSCPTGAMWCHPCCWMTSHACEDFLPSYLVKQL